jgi:hypothetical protein
VVSSGVTSQGKFGISRRSQAHIMTILRDNIYTDKILAVLREYSSNAWDAHRMVGKGDLPIQITLPDNDSPSLVIRDFGPGMSPREVFNIYTQYGESTKRGTDDAVGMMGIGSKSAFAYSDSFTVTSWNGGMRRIYVAVLDASNEGDMQCLDERAAGKTFKQFMSDVAFLGDLDDFTFYGLDTLNRMVESPEASALNIANYLAWLDAQEILNVNDMEAEISEDEIQSRRAVWDMADEATRIMIARTHAFLAFAPTADNDGVETGIEIQVSVKIHDLHEFRTKALGLFRYFDPHPVINISLPKIERKAMANGFVSSDMGEWIAVMGCIPYRLNLTHVSSDLEREGLWKPLQRIKGGLRFGIGEVHISASREELKYTDFTKKALVAKFSAMIDEHIEEALRDIRDVNLSDWDKRVKSNFMAHVVGFKLPKGFTDWSKQTVDLWGYMIPTSLLPKNHAKKAAPVEVISKKAIDVDDFGDEDDVPEVSTTYADVPDTVADPMVRMPQPRTFTLFGGRSDNQAIHCIQVTQGGNTRFVIKDDHRSMKGFSFNSYDYIVRPAPDTTVDEVRAELEEYVAKAKMTGVPIKLLSETGIAWYKPWEPEEEAKREKNPKYWTKAFKLKDSVWNCTSHHSQNWDPAAWEATDNDVYVLLDKFEPKSFGNGATFYSVLSEDKELATWMGLKMPPIYGYKDTYTSPANMKKVKGTEYKSWRTNFFTNAIKASAEVQALIEMMSWAIINKGNYVSDYYTDLTIKTTAKMAESLGSDHVFVTTLKKIATANAEAMKNRNKIKMVERIIKVANTGSESKKVMATLEVAYPLLFKVTDIFHMMDANMLEDWVAYIKVCDDAADYRASVALADEIMALDAQGDDDIVRICELDDSCGLPDRLAA